MKRKNEKKKEDFLFPTILINKNETRKREGKLDERIVEQLYRSKDKNVEKKEGLKPKKVAKFGQENLLFIVSTIVINRNRNKKWEVLISFPTKSLQTEIKMIKRRESVSFYRVEIKMKKKKKNANKGRNRRKCPNSKRTFYLSFLTILKYIEAKIKTKKEKQPKDIQIRDLID